MQKVMHPALRYSYKIVDRAAPLRDLTDKLLAWKSTSDAAATATATATATAAVHGKEQKQRKLIDIACDIEALVRPIEANTPKQLGEISLVQLCAPAVDESVNIIDVLSLGRDQVREALTPIMEGKEFRKVMFDCRRDVEALSSQLQMRPRCVLDLQLMYSGNQWKLRASDRRSGLQYVLKQELGLDRQAGDAAVSKAMLLGNRPVWDVRPLPEHFLEYAADDVRHLFALFDTMKLRHAKLLDASERISEEYVNFYAQGKAVEEEADPKSHSVRNEWLERYFGPCGVCGFCGQRGHHADQCFRRQAADAKSSGVVNAGNSSSSSSSSSGNESGSTVSSSSSSSSTGKSGSAVLRCTFCGGLGHLSTNCYKKNPQLLRCTVCSQMGHTAKHCFKGQNKCVHCGGQHRSDKCLKRDLMNSRDDHDQPAV